MEENLWIALDFPSENELKLKCGIVIQKKQSFQFFYVECFIFSQFRDKKINSILVYLNKFNCLYFTK